MTDPETSRHIEIKDGDQTVADADVSASAEPREPSGRRCAPRPGTSLRAAGPAWSTPSWTCPKSAKSRLKAAVPLGDGESLQRLRERADEVTTRPACIHGPGRRHGAAAGRRPPASPGHRTANRQPTTEQPGLAIRIGTSGWNATTTVERTSIPPDTTLPASPLCGRFRNG